MNIIGDGPIVKERITFQGLSTSLRNSLGFQKAALVSTLSKSPPPPPPPSNFFSFFCLCHQPTGKDPFLLSHTPLASWSVFETDLIIIERKASPKTPT